jgi:SAM-dependent methyltransferase
MLIAGKSLPRAYLECKLGDVHLSGRVLDLGGGGSRVTRYAHVTEPCRILTTDLRIDGNPDFVGDLERGLPLRDNSIDIVLLLNVMEHLYEYRTVISEAGRVLSPGGSLLLFVPFLYPRHTARFGSFVVEDYFRYGPVTLRRLLKELGGFIDVEIDSCGYGHSVAAADVWASGTSRRWARLLAYSTGVLLDRLSAARSDGAPLPTEWPIAFWVRARKGSSDRFRSI